MAATHGTLDVVVHFHRFRNVDLFSRGCVENAGTPRHPPPPLSPPPTP